MVKPPVFLAFKIHSFEAATICLFSLFFLRAQIPTTMLAVNGHKSVVLLVSETSGNEKMCLCLMLGGWLGLWLRSDAPCDVASLVATA